MKAVLSLAAIVSFAGVAGVAVYVHGNRYVTAPGIAGVVYKLDRRTGQTTMIFGPHEKPVEPEHVVTPPSPADQAIELAKANHGVEIQHLLAKRPGPLSVTGWRVKPIDEQTYVVGYFYRTGQDGDAFFFEVNNRAHIVREVPLMDERWPRDYVLNLLGDAVLGPDSTWAAPTSSETHP